MACMHAYESLLYELTFDASKTLMSHLRLV